MIQIQIFRFPGIRLMIAFWLSRNPAWHHPPIKPSWWASRQSWWWAIVASQRGGQSIQDQIEDPVDDDGAALTIVGARGPINSHWVTPICTQSHTPTELPHSHLVLFEAFPRYFQDNSKLKAQSIQFNWVSLLVRFIFSWHTKEKKDWKWHTPMCSTYNATPPHRCL